MDISFGVGSVYIYIYKYIYMCIYIYTHIYRSSPLQLTFNMCVILYLGRGLSIIGKLDVYHCFSLS